MQVTGGSVHLSALGPARYRRRTMRVFHREHAGRPVRVVWTLQELDEPYELTVISREENDSEEHRARHPLKRVPVLQDGTGFVFESAAICLHLADMKPQAGLIPPPGTHDRALVYQWACFAPAEMEPSLIEAMRYAERDPERAAKARARFDEAAAAVSEALGGDDYLVAGRFSVADVLVGSALAFTARGGFSDELPANLRAYLVRLAQRPARQRAVELTSG
jgi:glutathione S-transferase